MIDTGVPIQAFMGGLALGMTIFFVGCLLLLGAAIVRSLASEPFDAN